MKTLFKTDGSTMLKIVGKAPGLVYLAALRGDGDRVGYMVRRDMLLLARNILRACGKK